MRVLLVLIMLAVLAMIVWALIRWVQARAAATNGRSTERYGVFERTSGSEAHVLIGTGSPDTEALVGSVPIDSEDFDRRYSDLILRAEDRVATLNASRDLRQ